MTHQHYSDLTFGRLTNLLMSMAMTLPLLASNYEWQA
jgi:hypothetical protein